MIVINDKPHKKLEAWKKSIKLVTSIYDVTRTFPQDEEYGLKSQLRRAGVSVPSNIAEGLTRKTKKDKLHFINIAQGSLSEIDTQVEICLNMKYFSYTFYESIELQLIEIQKLLSGLSRVIQN
jgi:four helix bundle protein